MPLSQVQKKSSMVLTVLILDVHAPFLNILVANTIDILDYVTGIGNAQFACAICVALRSFEPDYLAPSSVPA